jgi:hypothetical protein
MQQAMQLRQSKHKRFRKAIRLSCGEDSRAVQRFPPLMPQTIRRSMRNTIKARVLKRVADQRPSELYVALPAEAV